MKISRLSLFFVVILLSLALASCAGGASTATGWPGLTVNGETAYLAYNTQVYAVNLTNGTEKWHFPEKGNAANTFFAPPVLTSDGQLMVGSYDKKLYSLDPETGQENVSGWPFAGAKNHYIAAPLVTENAIYAPDSDGSLYALDFSGKLLWTFATEHGLWATPVTDGETLYLPAMDHYVYAIHPADGSLLWKTEDLGGALVGQGTLAEDGTLYVGTLGAELIAIDTKANGQILWRTKTNGWVWSGPAMEEDMLYVGDLSGTAYGINRTDGAVVWQSGPEPVEKNSLTDRPLIQGDTLYFSSETGNLVALEKSNGALRWTKPVAGRLFPAPQLSGDLILVTPAGANSFLVGLDSSGNQKWVFPPPKE